MTSDENKDREEVVGIPPFAADHRDWFVVAEMEPGVSVVSEPGHVFSWLISGSDRTLLFDTGLGIADIRAAAESVVRSPLTVVNSHTHFDHIGGNELFDEVAMHELGPDRLAPNSTREELDAYNALAEEMEGAALDFIAADREGWFVLGPEQMVRPWPGGAGSASGWRIKPPPPQSLLSDGDTLSLGDRELRVIHTPGHAPDHICLLDESAGILFAQDQVYYGPHLVYLEGSDISDFAMSARRLADNLRGSIRSVYVAHSLRPTVPPAFLQELADAAESVAADEARLQPAPGLFGEPVLGADYGHFSILVPPRES